MTVAPLASETNRGPVWAQYRPIRLNLLDGFEMRVEGQPVTLRATEQRLLALIALRGRTTSRAHIAGTLWIDMTEERAMANLRSTLWRLRRCRLSVTETLGQSLQLATHVSVDLKDCLDDAGLLLDGTGAVGHECVDRLRSAGEVLPAWSDDWVVVERERFRQLRLHALEQACERYARDGLFGRAVDAGLAAVASDPLRESAHRCLIKAHLAEGNVAEARRQYREYERLMREELDLGPSHAMHELLEVRTGKAVAQVAAG